MAVPWRYHWWWVLHFQALELTKSGFFLQWPTAFWMGNVASSSQSDIINPFKNHKNKYISHIDHKYPISCDIHLKNHIHYPTAPFFLGHGLSPSFPDGRGRWPRWMSPSALPSGSVWWDVLRRSTVSPGRCRPGSRDDLWLWIKWYPTWSTNWRFGSIRDPSGYMIIAWGICTNEFFAIFRAVKHVPSGKL